MADDVLLRVRRLIDLIPYLASNAPDGLTVEELARICHVSENQILLDIERLSMCGPSEFDLLDIVVFDGVVSIQNHQDFTTPRSLSRTQLVALNAGLEMLAALLQTNETNYGEIKELQKKISPLVNLHEQPVQVETIEFSPHVAQTLETLHQAITSGKRCRITYESIARDLVSVREIGPLRIYSANLRFYVLANCYQRKSTRHFRLDNIRECELLDEAVIPPFEPAPEAPFKRATLRISSAAKYFLEENAPHLQVLSQSEFWTDAIFNFVDPEWLIRNVLVSRGQIQVIEPAEVAAEVRLRLEEGRKNYPS